MSTTDEVIRLNDINEKTTNKTVIVRIIHMWDQKETSAGKEYPGKEGLQMILMDESVIFCKLLHIKYNIKLYIFLIFYFVLQYLLGFSYVCKGDKIQSIISSRLKHKFKKILEEGKIFEIKNFQVQQNKPNLQNAKINHNFMINFSFATKVSKMTDDINIDQYGFQFLPFVDIAKHDQEFVLGKINFIQNIYFYFIF